MDIYESYCRTEKASSRMTMLFSIPVQRSAKSLLEAH